MVDWVLVKSGLKGGLILSYVIKIYHTLIVLLSFFENRDLKPSNVLVSNQHYSSLSKDQMEIHFSSRPIICKLADFGESRSTSIQTKSVYSTKTKRVDRGTPVFMSPEILVQGDKSFEASLDNMKSADIWALGMTFFTMINPNVKCPYLLEIRSSEEVIETQADVQRFVAKLHRCKQPPRSDGKYRTRQATVWAHLEEAYVGCINFDPRKRFSLSEIEEVLDGRCNIHRTCDIVKLNVTQSTAVEQVDRHIAEEIQKENQQPCPLTISNEATNACAFLAVKIADSIFHELEGDISDTVSFAKTIEKVIWFLPEKVNVHRDLAKLYDVLEAYAILQTVEGLNSRYDFFEELPFGDCIFSVESRKRLHDKLCVLGERDFAAIFSSDPYIILIGCAGGRPFIIDTHTGSLIVGRISDQVTWRSLCIWLWDRLLSVDVKEGTGQSLSVMKPTVR